MTKKKRELIEILLDNVKPEDWPDNLPFAAQDKASTSTGVSTIWIYQEKPVLSKFNLRGWNSVAPSKYDDLRVGVELCKHWNKTIVHRDEFMKRWNERSRVFVAITDKPPATMDTAKYEALEFAEIGGVKEDPVTYKSTKLKTPLVQNVDSEGWIQWNGGEMPVEKGTLIDVKYRRGLVNLHVKAGELQSGGSIPERSAIDFKHDDNPGDIIAYRLHVPQQQKTPQQLALEKFGTDWHDNEGVQPVDNEVLVDLIMCDGQQKTNDLADNWSWELTRSWFVKKWRIHSDEKESQIDVAAKSLSDGMKTLGDAIPTAQQAFDGFKKAAESMSSAGIESIIVERGINYGRFEDGAEIMQQLKLIAHTSQGWERMKPIQREGMDMVLHKIGRILNGDPSYVDSWIDIEGYSKLVSDWLKGDSK